MPRTPTLIPPRSPTPDVTGIKLGWTDESWAAVNQDGERWVNKAIGLMVSALLISFGAPFWHDLLTSVSNLKGILRGKGK